MSIGPMFMCLYDHVFPDPCLREYRMGETLVGTTAIWKGEKKIHVRPR
jgi:hypothetical protein